MTNFYALLGLPESLRIDPAAIDEAWRNRIRLQEGDSMEGDGDLNGARSTLADPVSRLAHWLELKAPGAAPERAIAPELMDLFAEIGPVLARADALLAKHRAASTALARAVLARDMVASQVEVQDMMARIQPVKSGLIARFAEFENEASDDPFGEARRALSQLKFLRRWEEQCRERLLAFLST